MANLFDFLNGVGNVLDLPGSSARDILSGQNPFDQWATPFSDKNRATGRDVLEPLLGRNKETGMSGWLDDPLEGVKDIAGFGLEVVADPLNLIPAGWFTKALKGRKAARATNAAISTTLAHPERARLASEMTKGFGEAADPTMKLIDSFALKNKLPPEQVYGKMAVGEMLDNPAGLADNQLAQIVHHGTPHTFAPEPGFPNGRFRLDKIGTGEGNQIRGKGIYFAESDKLGDQYRRSLSARHLQDKMLDMYSEGDDGIEEVLARLDEFTPDERATIKSLDEHEWLGYEYPHQAVKAAFSKNAGLDGDLDELVKVTKDHGSLFKLDLPDEDIPRMIDQDLYLDQQPSHVKKALEDLANDPAVDKFRKKQKDLTEEQYRLDEVFNGNNLDWVQISKARVNADKLKNMAELTPKIRAGAVIKQMLESEKSAWPPGSNAATGLKLKDELEKALGPDGAAEALRDAGIPGVKFKDAVSRSRNPLRQLVGGADAPTTNNYVVWDQGVLDRMALLERNGKKLQALQPEVNTLFQNPAEIRSAAEHFDLTKYLKPGYKDREKLINMPIDEFLRMANPLEKPSAEKLSSINEALDSGKTLDDVPFLGSQKLPGSTNDVVTAHEGRHRALALQNRGYTHMPVRLRSGDIRWSEQLNPKGFDYVGDDEWPANLVSQGSNDVSMGYPVPRENAMRPFDKDVLYQNPAELAKTETPEFKNWFGDWKADPANASKVVDAEGRPRKLYHGSLSNVESLRPQDTSSYWGKGVNLTTDPEDASRYASNDVEVNLDFGPKSELLAKELDIPYEDAKKALAGTGGNVYEVYADVRNPLYVSDSKINFDKPAFILAAAEANISRETAESLFKRVQNAQTGQSQIKVLQSSAATPIVGRYASIKGHDGLILEPWASPRGKGASHIVVFDEHKIKSVNNKGNWSPTNPNLLEQPKRGMTTFGDQGKAMINPMGGADFSTAPHETSHVLRRMLQGDQANQAAKIFGGEQGWNRGAEEAFATSTEGFLQQASTKSPAMQQSLQQMNEGMASVYQNPLPVRDGGTEFLNEMFGITPTSSPLDRARMPGLASPFAAGIIHNILARSNPQGGIQ